MTAKGEKTKNNPFPAESGFRILGIGKQEAIKYFFGGNATLAIIVIALIIGFLIYHSANFFPNYRNSLELYRKSGQEFVDFSSRQINAQKELKSLTIQAREYEVEERLGAIYRVASVHSDLKAKILKDISTERKNYKRSEDKLESLANASANVKAAAEKEYNTALQALRNITTSVTNDYDYSDVSNRLWKTDEKYLQPIRDSIIENIVTGKTSPLLAEIRDQEAQLTAEVDTLPFIIDLKEANAEFSAPLLDFGKFVDKHRKVASKNKAQAVHHAAAADKLSALKTGAKISTTEEQRKRKEIEIKRILLEEPDYDSLNASFYKSLDEHNELLSEMIATDKAAFTKVPEASQFESKIAKRKIRKIKELETEIFELFKKQRSNMESWSHKKDFPIHQAVTGFFFGTDWITNSSWQDIYGILPLLAGSVAVAIASISIAVPFSVGGAIYVNRLASKSEQKLIKPFIEFIEAIPSIVLAFFGVVVLGSLIQTYSQSPLVSWIPGLPVEGRLTILNASLLLALMSIPTIFTLCEDALNNVPKAYREASLALGATKLQTIIKVILPSCASGIIAAILLGFGRIIGETMVVLLVMGGRIAIPESFTDPAHSMTGILAQEIGEVDEGSLHWGALFMVGLVLFTIALSLNYLSQRILAKLSK
ncbi:MAG: phosphate ABC transporter permease subunit PstC [Akkermansiaceae bacterium]